MTMNLIPRVSPVNSIPHSKHCTEDPNERRRRQLRLVYGYSANKTVSAGSVSSRPAYDTVEISEEGRKLLAKSQHK